MNSPATLAAIALAGTTLILLIPAPALAYTSAPMTVCNKSPMIGNDAFDVVVAYGYHSPGVHDPADHSLLTGPFVSRGWWAIKPGECKTLENPFDARYMFWFAPSEVENFDASKVLSMRTSDAPDHFCVNNFLSGSVPGFTYEDENESADACDKDGSIKAHNLWVAPHVVDTWVNATVNFPS